MFELDDEEITNDVSTIDNLHQFLNFSRKVTESSSMKRPVDIQLGIACGKDLIFASPILSRRPLQQQQQTIFPTKTLSSPKNTNKKATHTPLPVDNPQRKASLENTPIFKLPSKPLSSSIKPTKKRSSYTSTTSHQPQANMNTSSPLLDRLVADVLSHIESCPDQSAYSEDLDNLKPKLEAYYTRPSLSNVTSS